MSKRNRETGVEEEAISSSKKVRIEVDHKPGLRKFTHDAYTVAWVCALPKEQTAAIAMLDQMHPNLHKPPKDHNTYTLGTVGRHNVVIACLPKGRVGTSPAATVATQMIDTFPSIKVCLMVGIGGGVPKVRLGDVVLSTPADQFPGVVQWDFGKAGMNGKFRRTGALSSPPNALLTALSRLETQHDMVGSKMPEYLDELKEKWPKLVPKYLKSDSLEDVLFKADYNHITESTAATEDNDDEYDEYKEAENCQFCDKTEIVKREPREMRVHYGLIASGNQVIKDARSRDRLNEELGGQVLCIEMEAAGLMSTFPCIVIRGICDYADSHKNKDWQEHAAAVAAAFAKELLDYVQPSDVDGERSVKDALNQVSEIVSQTRADVARIMSKMDRDENAKILNWLTPVDYGSQQSDFLRRRHEGTGTWLLRSTEFNKWLGQTNQTLFCQGIPGAGKTILTSIVVDHLHSKFRTDPDVGIACLYINFRQQQQQRPEDLLLSILKQWLQSRNTMPEDIQKLYEWHKDRRSPLSLTEIVKSLEYIATLYSQVMIIIDALDECDDSDGNRQNFVSAVLNVQKKTGANLFVTSRINHEIAKFFSNALSLEICANQVDVESYIDFQISLLPSDIVDNDLQDRIRRDVLKSVDGMFLIAQLHMDNLKRQPTKGDIKQALQHLAKGADELYKTYDQTMERIRDQGGRIHDMAKRILGWIVHALRPLSTTQLRHALAIRPHTTNLDEDYLPSAQLIQSVCAGLVIADEESGIIRLVHYTAQEYFEKTWTTWFPDAHTDITESCVTYLSFDVFDTICQSHEAFQERIRTNSLYNYAANYWGHHASKTAMELDKILKFLKSREKVFSASQARFVPSFYGRDYQDLQCRMTGIHVAAFFGLERVIRRLLDDECNIDDEVNSRDSYHGRAPLTWGAIYGHEGAIKLLLDTGKANVNIVDDDGNTPLAWAKELGRDGIVTLLQSHGAVS